MGMPRCDGGKLSKPVQIEEMENFEDEILLFRGEECNTPQFLEGLFCKILVVNKSCKVFLTSYNKRET